MPTADATQARAATIARCQADLNDAVADVARLADRPAGGWTAAADDELFMAAFRLRDARRALDTATVGDDAVAAPSKPCDFAPWCDGTGPHDYEPDVVPGARQGIYHARRWALDDGPIGRVSIAQLQIPPESPRRRGDDVPMVVLDHVDGLRCEPIELTVGQADRLAAAVYKAVDTYRQAGR